jgi:mannan endo-1,4-beta-mannosidase
MLMFFLALLGTAASASDARRFVTRQGNQLVLDGKPYTFAGANQYYLFFKDQRMADDVFRTAKDLGMNALRTWAFCEGGAHDGFCFQPKPGVYDEATFRNLDYAIYKAGKEGIKLILPLANNWGGHDHFGGIDQYLSWVSGSLGHDDFYDNKEVRELYKKYVSYVLNRVNTYTGVAYKDDPTILMWELINEPRAQTDNSKMIKWVNEMADYVKRLDPNHLVANGGEGDYSTPYLELNSSPNIDIVSIHLYPEAWGFSLQDAANYLRRNIQNARKVLGKPVYVGEFGFRGIENRTEVYTEWYKIMHEEGVSGALVWLLSGRQFGFPIDDSSLYPDYDGFTIYGPNANDTPQTKETREVIKNYTNLLRSR